MDFVQIIIAIASCLTALFMYLNLIRNMPFLEAEIKDVSHLGAEESSTKEWRDKGYYLLGVRIHGGGFNCQISSIRIHNCLIDQEPFIDLDKTVKTTLEPKQNKYPIEFNYLSGTSKHFNFLIKPQNPESGELKVTVSLGLFMRISKKVSYKKEK